MIKIIIELATGQGFEPRFTASKAAVLPLDDPVMGRNQLDSFKFSISASSSGTIANGL